MFENERPKLESSKLAFSSLASLWAFFKLIRSRLTEVTLVRDLLVALGSAWLSNLLM